MRALGTRDRGVFDDSFFVTRNTLAPAVLVELAFINNPAEGPRTVDPASRRPPPRPLCGRWNGSTLCDKFHFTALQCCR